MTYVNRWQASLDVIYEDFGLDGRITPGTGTGAAEQDIRVLNKTAEFIVTDHNDVQTIRPAVCVRMSQLGALGIAHTELDGGSLTFASKTWRIHSHLLKPTPDGGDLTGEAALLLMDTSA